jgi:GNAT superfamily N-acetyltransferase
MQKSNFERMIELADQIFSSKNDPQQLDVNEAVMEGLFKIHPACLSEYEEGEGPLAWIIVIPTSKRIMNAFLKKEISEKELYEQTLNEMCFETIYLCSALVHDEYRKKGIAKKICLEAIEKIQKNHGIDSLFVWSFTPEGVHCAESIAKATKLALLKRED